MNEKYEIQEIGQTLLYMALCVPPDVTDAEAVASQFPSGTSGDWLIAEDQADPDKLMCTERPGCRHLILEC